MIQRFKIKKGLDIRLKGKPLAIKKQTVSSEDYTLFPDDFHGFIPKVAIKAGDKVRAGTAVLFDKNRPTMKIVAPVSGEVIAINRGEKRKLLNLVIRSDGKNQSEKFDINDWHTLAPEALKDILAKAGILAFLKQRPFDVAVDPKDTPRDIFVSGFYSSPLAPDLDFILEGQENDFQTGLDVLAAITTGKVYLNIRNTTQAACLKNARNAEIVVFEGPHPAGNVGIQINHIQPINKGETVWTIDPAQVLFIGRFFNKGVVDFSRWFALTGSEAKKEERAYYQAVHGVCLEELMRNAVLSAHKHLRCISGNILTGTQIASNGSLHAFDNQVTIIPEGNDTNEFLGWITPGINKFSASRTFPSFILNALKPKEYIIDARLQGGRRAMIMANEWDKVFPMDILPEFLIRAILSKNIDKMEKLGIYEVAPEDFALCEFVDTSKMELQAIVRHGLDWLHKEENL